MSRIIIVDLEATCDDPRPSFQPQETIEIGAVAVDIASRNIIGEFNTFVRPVIHPILTDFCKKLTTIAQNDVAGAKTFGPAFATFSAWAGDSPLCSWSRWDWQQLQEDCRRASVPFTFRKHFNLPGIAKRHCGIASQGRLLKFLGLSFIGQRHRGIDDARNYARITLEILNRGWPLE